MWRIGRRTGIRRRVGIAAECALAAVLVLGCSKKQQEAPQPAVSAPVGEQVRVRHILVRYRGAEGAPPTLQRSKTSADSLIHSLADRVRRGDDFGNLARAFSDDPSHDEGGEIQPLVPGETPPEFERVAFALKPGDLSKVFESPMGFHLVQRLGVGLVGIEHILIRYRGAETAPDSIRRTRTEALALAESILALVRQPQTSFPVAAAAWSEDELSAPRGGYVGEVPRGRMVKPFENVAFALEENAISGIVETPFGFHILKRVKIETIRVQHILIAQGGTRGLGVKATRTEQEALKRALDVLFRARKGESFDDLAREFSDDQLTASRGGRMPRISRGQTVPEFEEVAFGLAPGQVSDVVRTEFGFHIIRRSSESATP